MTPPTAAQHAALLRTHEALVREHRRLQQKVPLDIAEHRSHVETLRRHIELLKLHRARLPDKAMKAATQI